MAQGQGAAAAKGNTRTGCGCLVAIVVVGIIIAVAASGGGGGSKSSSASSSTGGAQAEARAYIHEKEDTINLGRVDYEHVAALIVLLQHAGGESEQVVDELAKVAQEAHDEIDGFRQELFKTEGNEKLKEATFELSEGANELKNAMGAMVAYTANPNPATLAHLSIQLEAAKGKWNEGVDEIWTIAGEHGAYRLK
jgi:hypothetical protein